MAFDYINEAFKKLDILEEQMFDTSLQGINQLSDFLDNDNVDTIVRVIDPEATTEEDIQDSYVGKVIINCNICHSHIFEDKDNIAIDEDSVVNKDMQCPYCGEADGFTIVGEIAPYAAESAEEPSEESTDTDVEITEEPEVVETEDEEIQVEEEDDSKNESLSMSRATKRTMQEDFKEVSITTEDQHLEMSSDESGKVTVVTEPIQTESTTEAEMIVPVSDETEEEILNNNDESDEEDFTSFEEDESVDFDFDNIDEEGLDELGESYLHNVYENVKSFKTTNVSANSSALIVEGVITFNSGAQKKTGFIFEAKDVNSRGQVRFSGSNKHFTESKDIFSLVGRVDNKKLFVESLKYNYKVNDTAVRGIVRRK